MWYEFYESAAAVRRIFRNCYHVHGNIQSSPSWCATGVTVKIVAASATVALNNIYHAFLIFQSYVFT
jgi:hypothetical protein